jgi:hypothetical protein
VRIERPFDDQPMGCRQDDLDPPMGAVTKQRHSRCRHLTAMDLNWQEHRRRLDGTRRCEPPILLPFEDQVGIQRMPLCHLEVVSRTLVGRQPFGIRQA